MIPLLPDNSQFKREGKEIDKIHSFEHCPTSRVIIDVTSLDSQNEYMENITEITLNINYSYNGHEQLDVDFKSKKLVDYQITDNKNTIYNFKGFIIKRPEIKPLVHYKILTKITIRIIGKILIDHENEVGII